MKIKMMPSPEVAAFLRRALGPIRAWDDCLADMRIEKTSVSGLVLLPFATVHDGKAARPYYRTSDIEEFVRAVNAANPDARPGIPLKIVEVEYDPADRRSWKARTYKLSA
jgi:hypothetical protein